MFRKQVFVAIPVPDSSESAVSHLQIVVLNQARVFCVFTVLLAVQSCTIHFLHPFHPEAAAKLQSALACTLLGLDVKQPAASRCAQPLPHWSPSQKKGSLAWQPFRQCDSWASRLHVTPCCCVCFPQSCPRANHFAVANPSSLASLDDVCLNGHITQRPVLLRPFGSRKFDTKLAFIRQRTALNHPHRYCTPPPLWCPRADIDPGQCADLLVVVPQHVRHGPADSFKLFRQALIFGPQKGARLQRFLFDAALAHHFGMCGAVVCPQIARHGY